MVFAVSLFSYIPTYTYLLASGGLLLTVFILLPPWRRLNHLLLAYRRSNSLLLTSYAYVYAMSDTLSQCGVRNAKTFQFEGSSHVYYSTT